MFAKAANTNAGWLRVLLPDVCMLTTCTFGCCLRALCVASCAEDEQTRLANALVQERVQRENSSEKKKQEIEALKQKLAEKELRPGWLRRVVLVRKGQARLTWRTAVGCANRCKWLP